MAVENLYNIRKHINQPKKQSQKGFTMLSFSIVLVILSTVMLIAVLCINVVQMSRMKAFIAEFNLWKKAFNTFYVAKGRLPGDLNSDGFIGPCWGYGCGIPDTWTASSFSAPYDIEPNSDETHYITPFIELHLEGLIDFAPDPKDLFVHKGLGARCHSKTNSFSGGYFWFESFGDFDAHPRHYLANTKPGSVIIVYYNDTSPLKADLVKKLDTKMDDGIYNAGSFRAQCSGSETVGFNNYDDAVKHKKGCKTVTFRML